MPYKDPQKARDNKRAYYYKNKEKLNAYALTNRNKYKEKRREYDRRYCLNHPGKIKESGRKRRAKNKQVCENYTHQDELFTTALFSFRCFNCRAKSNLTIDHVYPISKGYALTRTNACVLCFYCNNTKHNKWPEEFYSPDRLQELFTLLGLIDPVYYNL